MTLVDTSAWIEFSGRGGDLSMKNRVHDCLPIAEAAHSCPVNYELILETHPRELAELNLRLDIATRIIATADHWDHAAGLAAGSRAKGLNFPAFGLLIAMVAFTAKVALLTCDPHFTIIQDRILPDLVLA